MKLRFAILDILLEDIKWRSLLNDPMIIRFYIMH